MSRKRTTLALVATVGAILGFAVGTVAHRPCSTDSEPKVHVRPWHPDTPVEFIPYEGLLHHIRTIVDPKYTGGWSGTAYDLLNLNAYLGQWHRTAPEETFRLAGWQFGVGLVDDQSEPGTQTITDAIYVVGPLTSNGAHRTERRVRLWARWIGAAKPR